MSGREAWLVLALITAIAMAITALAVSHERRKVPPDQVEFGKAVGRFIARDVATGVCVEVATHGSLTTLTRVPCPTSTPK